MSWSGLLVVFVACFIVAAAPGACYYAYMRLRHPEWWR